MTLKQSKLTSWLVLLLSVVVLSACSMFRVTNVNDDHSLIQPDLNRPLATVYFIRPTTEHPMGYADNKLGVEIDGEELMKLGKAEYTMVYLKPRDVTITLRNRTQASGRWEVTELERSRQFSFKAGEIYFILADMFDGEFRGAHFVPKSISLFDAKIEAEHLTPTGFARDNRIKDL